MEISKDNDYMKTTEYSSRVATEVLHNIALSVNGVHQFRTNHANLVNNQHGFVRP
jgi:hypothetical protein